MKATKFVLIIAFLAFATMSYSTEIAEIGSNTVKISLKKAMENRGIVKAIYQQVDPRTFLYKEQNFLYIARVSFRHVHYVIFGKYEEWVNFFLMDQTEEAPAISAPVNDQPIFSSTQ